MLNSAITGCIHSTFFFFLCWSWNDGVNISSTPPADRGFDTNCFTSRPCHDNGAVDFTNQRSQLILIQHPEQIIIRPPIIIGDTVLYGILLNFSVLPINVVLGKSSGIVKVIMRSEERR